jgi:EAL domain-containing protein (putative c-di-GMP-specific phosphodiesterase class I)
VLLPDTDRRGALEVARKLLDVIDAPFVVDSQDLTVGTSIGVALCPDHGSDAETLLRHADVAMYLAKRSHSGYAVYDVEQDEHSKRRLALTSELREALTTGDLLVYYQPLVDLERDAVVGVEALVRWPHSQHGFIPPDYFIPLAEHTGLIAPLTTFVLETALQQCQSWQRAGRSIGVAVNISTRVLHDTDFPGAVAALLARYEVPPALLTLEITESALMMDPERALGVLQSLSALGLHTAIDDFGTGYSSLGYLKQLPVDEVKIDKSFVFGMDENPKDEAIVRSVVAMAHAMGLVVVAEGVENGEAWELLRGLGCDVVQGYYVSRPLPATELARWLDTSSWGSAMDKASA